MAQLTFPIVEVQENRLIALDGNVGSFYRLDLPDLEQLSPLETTQFFASLALGLNHIGEEAYFKFYHLAGGNYLESNTSDLPYFEHIRLVSEANALPLFFGHQEIFSDISLGDDYLNFNGQYWRILSVSEFSENLIDRNFMPRGVDFVLKLKKKTNDQALKTLERVRNSHQAALLKDKRDIASEGAYQQAEQLIEELTHGKEALFEIELCFILKASGLKELNLVTKEFQERMQLQGLKLFCEGQSLRLVKSGLGQFFNELIPGVKPSLWLRSHTDKTSHVQYLLPLRQSHLMASGIEFDDIHGQALYFGLHG